MEALTAAQMREADRRCIQELGIPGAVLMNNAGQAVFNEVGRGALGVVCGRGNNGGDGFVVGRLALLAGLDTTVLLIGRPDALAGDAATFCSVYRKLGGAFEWTEDADRVIEAMGALGARECLVDALLGTGFTGPVRDPIMTAIEHWPKVRTVSVDVPSGLDADTGEGLGPCIRADVTVTFQFAKRGFLNPSAQAFLGRLVIADIGIPAVCADDRAWNRLTASSSWSAR